MSSNLVDYFAKVRADLRELEGEPTEPEPDPARLAARYAHGYQED